MIAALGRFILVVIILMLNVIWLPEKLSQEFYIFEHRKKSICYVTFIPVKLLYEIPSYEMVLINEC
jgi:hypothetical protein